MSGATKKKIVIANWKQHFNISEASHYMHKLQEEIKSQRDVEIVIAPGFVALQPLSKQIDFYKFKLAAQTVGCEEIGANTGEVGAPMLKGLTKYVIVGHSHQRIAKGVDDKQVTKKVAAVLRNGMRPIICIGETAVERGEGHTDLVINSQLEAALSVVDSKLASEIVVAYEPVWAISTNKDAKQPTAFDIQLAINKIEDNLRHHFGAKNAEKIRVIYGGSVDSNNASGFMTEGKADGFLVGSASLHYKEFANIVAGVHNVKH